MYSLPLSITRKKGLFKVSLASKTLVEILESSPRLFLRCMLVVTHSRIA